MIFGKHINRYYLKYGFTLLLGLLALVCVDYFQLKIPEIYNLIINGMTYGEATVGGEVLAFNLDFLLDKVCLPICIIILFMVLGRFLWRLCFFGAGLRLVADLRKRMFNHCKDLSQQYYQINKVGNLMSLFTNDLSTIEECFAWGILMFFDATFLGGLAVYKMFRMHRLLALLSFLPMLFLMIAGTIIGQRLMKKWDKRQEAFSALSDFSQESFSGISVIKAFVKEGKELLAFKKLNKENEDINVDYVRSSVLLRIFISLFVESVICIILGYGGYLVYHGVFNAGELFEFIGYFTTIIWPVMAVSELIELSSRGKASLKRVSELLDAKQDVIDRQDVRPLDRPICGKIEFRHLDFTYPDGDEKVLSDVSFTIEAGENVGIVGRTGVGKTTVVDLILRTYNVQDGTLFIDDNDVNTIPIRSVRESCAYVPQDNFLFSDTIANNISFSTDDKAQSSIEEAARLSDVHENITGFTEGYETVLGERGVTVSGGQKQRISIARALMKNAPILILDDSVSAVDTKTEEIILRNLRETRKGKTTLLIAHRISTIESMDKILFLDDGRLAAVGTHESLYRDNESYRRMVDLQKLEDEGGENTNA